MRTRVSTTATKRLANSLRFVATLSAKSAKAPLRPKGKKPTDYAALAGKYGELYGDTISAVNNLCSDSDYLSHNTDLCSTVIPSLKATAGVAKDAAGQKALQAPDAAVAKQFREHKLEPKDYNKAKAVIEAQAARFEGTCMVNGARTTEVIGDLDCDQEYKNVLENLAKLRDLESKLAKDPSEANAANSCGVPLVGAVPAKTQNNLSQVANAAGCPGKAKAYNIAKCNQDLACGLPTLFAPVIGDAVLTVYKKMAPQSFSQAFGKCDAGGADSCSMQAMTSLLSGLWGTLKGMVSLGGMAVDAVKTGWHWVTGNTVEDEAAKRMHAIGKTASQEFAKFTAHPFGYIKEFITTALNGIKQWVKSDVLCQQWEGVPHFSECKDTPFFV